MIPTHRFMAGASATVLAALLPLGLCARESWPQPTAADKARAAEVQRYEDAVWKRIEPEVRAGAKNGKPYIPNAGMPGVDLPQASVPAFPGAEGAGAHSFGGRGGRVYVVTSLADSGPGTFREACEAAGPRIIVFNVAGIIRLKSRISIRAPYLTIAGQTAPGDGVCVAGATTEIDTHDVVVRYMRFRRGETNVMDRDDAFGGDPIGNVIIDHCSASWGFDENLSMYRHMYTPPDGGKDIKLPTVHVTIQWSISSEALDTFNHAFGGTWGGREASFHHNLFANNTGRNPSIGWGDQIDFRDNVLYNWRHRTIDGGDATSLINVVANYYKPGPAVNPGAIAYRVAKPEAFRNFHESPHDGQWYVAGNVVEGYPKVTADNWDGGVQLVESKNEKPAAEVAALVAKGRSAKPFPAPPITQQTAAEAYQLVLAGAGATLPHRDPVDTRIINEVRTGKPTYTAGKGIITDIEQVGGYPEYHGTPIADLGADGIPASWKKKYGLDANDAALASKDLAGDGYTVIDKYLDGLDPTKQVAWSDPAANVNSLAGQVELGSGARPNPDAEYAAKLETRVAAIVGVLALNDATKAGRVHDTLIAQYRALNAWHDAHDVALKTWTKEASSKDKAAASAARQQVAAIQRSLLPIHEQFLAALAVDLSPVQIETVKNQMTYNKVKVTYDAYCEIVPNLTEPEKARIMALLDEAREDAMDGGSAEEKSAIFNRYKGKINNFLSAQGHNVSQAYKDWGAREHAQTTANATAPGK
jgi:pectate lyase